MNAVDFFKDGLETSTSKVMTRAERMGQLTKSLAPQGLGWAIYTTRKDNKTVYIANHGEYFNRIIIDGADVWPAHGYITHTFEKAGPHLVYLGLDPDTTTLLGCFSECKQLNMLDLSNWKTDKITSMHGMFSYCQNLVSIRTKKWNVENITDASRAFYKCERLKFLDINGWNIKRVQDTRYMFGDCVSLSDLDLSDWNTKDLYNADHMFSGCAILGVLNLGGWDVKKLRIADNMFSGCGIIHLNLSGWDVGGLRNRLSMFYGYNEWGYFDLEGWSASDVDEILKICPNIAYGQ